MIQFFQQLQVMEVEVVDQDLEMVVQVLLDQDKQEVQVEEVEQIMEQQELVIVHQQVHHKEMQEVMEEVQVLLYLIKRVVEVVELQQQELL